MKILFFCINSDHLTVSQILKATNLISENLSINLDQFELILKPAKYNVNFNLDRLEIFKRRIYKIITLKIVKSIYVRIKFKILLKKNQQKNFLKTHVVSSANSEDTYKIIRDSKEKLVIFVNYDEIIKEDILSICEPLNVHYGFLPEFRGISPLVWQIKKQKQIAAITIHRMTSGIDDGDIIAEVPFSIETKKNESDAEMAIYKNDILANALYLGVRRLLKFDLSFGIPQNTFKGDTNYYGRQK